MIRNNEDLCKILRRLYGVGPAPKSFKLLLAASRVDAGEDLSVVAKSISTTPSHLRKLLEAKDRIQHVLGSPWGSVTEDKRIRASRSLGQMLLGGVAEKAFEDIYRTTVGSAELNLERDPDLYTDTDYRVRNGKGRRVFRINIKFHGSSFQKAMEHVGLEPEDCFALATYKIHAALEKQQAEHLPYIFAIVGVRGLTAELASRSIPEDLLQICCEVSNSDSFPGKRGVEDAIVAALLERPEEFSFREPLQDTYQKIRNAPWFALSARKAANLLKDLLFERVYALKVRAFARNYQNAELDMHFSLAKDLTPLPDFLTVLRDEGLPALIGRLERGTF